MKKVKHDLLSEKHTTVWHEDEIEFNAPHHFTVLKQVTEEENDNFNIPFTVLSKVDFQKGPIKEAGVNGVCNEDLLVMVLTRLEGFQNSEFRCRENALAITKIEEALLWLRKRTMGRENRGVEGTNQK